MIARNFIHHPEALLAQRELELVIAAPEALTKAASDLIGKSLRANVAWACELTTVRIKQAIPAWFAAMKRRAMALAKAVRTACLALTF